MGCSCHRAKGQARTGLCQVQVDAVATAGEKGRDKQGHWGPVGLGSSLPSMGSSRATAPPSSGEGKAGGEATDTVPALGTHSHSPILPLCAILGLWTRSILNKAIAFSIAVMVIPCCCFNIPLARVRDFLGMEYIVMPQTQVVRRCQKQQCKDK